MLHFKKLRLSGFKSFVDATDLVVEEGLTGIVGPNGCGKSNLVEALRWVMGETSAKQMRGGEMDDVIFGGTASRPARNVGEVILNMDNTARGAPAIFNDHDELEISRRIERDKGSTYRVNGKEVRARDVQLLFADAATGARSTAMVSQGRIGAIIAAKPVQRRALLEEAAGITGLHSRRHEAELRLRGAETNLERLDDILVTLDVQLKNLKKQSRQATRYRNLSDHIRKAEATLFHLRWLAAKGELEVSLEKLKEAESQVTELTRLTSAASTRQAEEAAGLPALRQVEAEAAAELHRLVVARDGLDAEEQRIEAAVADCRQRLEQIAADSGREQARTADAEAANERLDEERTALEAAADGEEESRQAAAEALAEAAEATDSLDAQLSELTERVANDEARRGALSRAVGELDERIGRLTQRRNDIERSRSALSAESGEEAALGEAEGALKAAHTAFDEARTALEAAENARTSSSQQETEAVAALHQAQAALTRLQAEEEALAEILAGGDTDDMWSPLIDSVSVEPGLEAALGAAIGDDLSAPADQPAPVHWRTLGELADAPSLPAGAQPLSRYVEAPPVLARRLSQIGLVTDEEEGGRLAGDLRQGQRLVGRDGSLWRWDGFTISAGAPTAAATRLEQRNRLADIREELIEVTSRVTETENQADAARSRALEATEHERQARAAVNAAGEDHNQTREALAAIKEKLAERTSRLESLREATETVASDLSQAEQQLTEANQTMANLPDPEQARQRLTALRAEVAERRGVQLRRQGELDSIDRAAAERQQRQQAITRELASWQERRQDAAHQMQQLQDRRQSLNEELERLSALPAEITGKRSGLMDQIDTSEAKRKTAADALAEAENRLGEAEQSLRGAETALARAREERVRFQGLVEQARQSVDGITERVAEKLDCRPDDLFEVSGLKEDADLPELEAVERKVERLHRERETMGPVNLRAEQEAGEMTEQIDTLNVEREDLIAAIEKLRRGISELNREGRQRLLASFKEVDQHFQELFVRLYGGGRAHLSLVDSDDPLEAGLEIMASPPGKKLQVLSLLSGGEQALTALALLFAVFMTNPAPICVLDEVDAPLDDANVDRFCTLLDEMSESGHTRFLIITHHRMTMARMHRLFGVTMMERGVSQLVSVDLQRAEELRATA